MHLLNYFDNLILLSFYVPTFHIFILSSLVIFLSLSFSLCFSFFTHFIHYIISFPCCYYFLNVLFRCLLDILLTFKTHVFTTHITVLYGMENWFLRLSFVPCAGVSGDQSSIRILFLFRLKLLQYLSIYHIFKVWHGLR